MTRISTLRQWISRLPYSSFRTSAQSQSLLRIIALAVEQRLPLAPLLQTFAKDQTGHQRGRVERLATLLDEGSSLPAALEQVAHVLPLSDVLAIRFGTQSGTLAATLRDLIDQSGDSEDSRLRQRLRGLFLYEGIVFFVLVMITVFLLVFIWPKLTALMSDSGVERPMAFKWAVDVGDFFARYWWLVVGPGLLLAWAMWTERPGRFLRRGLVLPWSDMRSADVLQSLSIVAEAGRPILGGISTLARYHHDPTLRQKLLFVCNEVEHGADLWGTLGKVNLLTPTEVSLMETSEKVGNRPWTIAQLATIKRRRLRHRVELVSHLASPIAILLLGGVVFALCLGVFGPLVKMILASA